MKKLIVLLLCAALALSLVACAPAEDSGKDPAQDQNPPAGQDPDQGSTPADDGNTPDDADTPDDTTPDDGNTPADGTTDEGNTPADGATPDDGTAPDVTNPPSDGIPGEDNTGDNKPSGTPAFPVPGSGADKDNGGDGGSDGQQDTPQIQLGFPSINVPGGNDAPQEVPVTDAGDLVDKLAGIVAGIVPETYTTHSLEHSTMFGNYFDGKLQYTEGMRVACNSPMMVPPAHIILLVAPAEGTDVNALAAQMKDNADPMWEVCVSAPAVRVSVKDGLILFVMSTAEIADAVVSAFEG